jgi:hypothetical protein
MCIRVTLFNLPGTPHKKWLFYRSFTWFLYPSNIFAECPPAFIPLCVVLWSFKPGTYQTGSFVELTLKFQTCGTRSRKFRAPSPTPNAWDPRAAYRFYLGLWRMVIDEVWLAFPQWRTITLTQRNETKSHEWAPRSCSNCSSDSCRQQGQQLPSKSSDDFVRALAITVD